MYFDDYKKYPPTQADCALGGISKHLYQLPKVLAEGHYLPNMPRTQAMYVGMEDRFNCGHTYKYRAVGEIIIDRDIVDKYMKSRLWIPDRFPAETSVNLDEGQWYSEPHISPVTWVIFSLGPGFSEEWLYDKTGTYDSIYPIPKELWYKPEEGKGFLVRMRLSDNGSHMGSFERR